MCNVILLSFWISLFAKSHPARLGSSSPLNPLPHATGRHGDEFLLIPYGTLLGQAARLVRDAVLKDLEAAPLLRVVASVLDTGEGKPIARQHCSPAGNCARYAAPISHAGLPHPTCMGHSAWC